MTETSSYAADKDPLSEAHKEIEDRAYVNKVAWDLGWAYDTGLSPAAFLCQIGLKVNGLLDDLGMLVRATKHLALATPDKRLRVELERASALTAKVVGEFSLMKMEEAPTSRKALVSALGLEQALYRTAFREDTLKEQLATMTAERDAAAKTLQEERNMRRHELHELKEAHADVEALEGVVAHVRSELRTEKRDNPNLISRHAKGCPHFRNETQNVFMLSDPDSYDCCTCLVGHVSQYQFDNVKRCAVQASDLLSEAGDASLGGLHQKWKDRKNVLLKVMRLLRVLPKEEP